MTTSDTSASLVGPPGNMRQRSRYACAPCRQRKRKCDGKFPCSTCTGYGYECQYNTGATQQESSNIDLGTASTARTPQAASVLTTKRKRSITAMDSSGSPSSTNQKSKTSPGTRGFGNEIASTKDRVPSSPLTNGILIPSKCRHIGRHSSVAFPRWLGENLQSMAPPRLHSFAYNTGVRKELPFAVSFQIQSYITWAEVHDSLDIYATVIHPVFGFVDMEDVRRRSHEHWHGNTQGTCFEALITGIIGLASLFSKVLCEGRELRVIQHAKDILDDPYTTRLPRLETVQAWILRTIYIRSTSRPGSAWLYSCITMHLCETTGANRDREAHEWWSKSHRSLEELKDLSARVMMVARCLHIIISYEHGRSIVDVGPVLEHNLIKRSGDLTLHLYELVNALRFDDSSQDQPARRQELTAALSTLISTPTDHEFFSLIKGDLCFCIYRRLRLLDLGIGQEQLSQVMQAGNAALPAARILILRNHPWWNTVGTVFQYICVLLAIDSTESLAAIPEAIETLETIAKHLKTHMADEALSTARLLLRSMTEKKRKEAAILEKTAEKTTVRNLTRDPSANADANEAMPAINNDSTNDEPSLTHATTMITHVTGDTTLQRGLGELEKQQDWNGLLDFMDPLWNWDAFFESPLATMQTAPLMDESLH